MGATCDSPARDVGQRSLSRRGFLRAGLGAAGGLSVLLAPQAFASVTVQVWGLAAGASGGSCCAGCTACRLHAENKLFASAADADLGRAHPYCRCQVVSLGTVDEDVYTALFVDGGRRGSADRRHDWVQSALERAPDLPPPPAPPQEAPAGGIGGQDWPLGTPIPSGPLQTVSDLPLGSEGGNPEVILAAPATLTATLRSVYLRRRAGGVRWLYADVETPAPVIVTIALLRGQKTIVRRRIFAPKGRRTVKLLVPRSAGRGPARVWVRFADFSGAERVLTKSIVLPSPPKAAAGGRSSRALSESR